MSDGFTHLKEDGAAHMVDISAKAETIRVAVAAARIVMQPDTLEAIRNQSLAKGDVLATVRLAGIMAAKRTSDLIPLCHPLPLSSVAVDIALAPQDTEDPYVEIRATAKTKGATGVEMEAMTAASVAALTLYDMCKAIDRGMRIEAVHLVHKSGGKSGTFNAPLATES